VVKKFFKQMVICHSIIAYGERIFSWTLFISELTRRNLLPSIIWRFIRQSMC